jgi:xanthine dehydrogenase accessory factor
MAREVGFRVTVADARSLFATPERFPEADVVIRGWPDEVLPTVGLDRYSYVVILSHDPKFDRPALQHALRSPARYIGAMGSRTTHAERRNELREMGFTDEDLARIHSPIGLSIGARTPEEIAVSILAEMIDVRRGAVSAARDMPVAAH